MSAEPISAGVRAVLDAPRGRRFSRPGASAVPAPPTREQRLLARMEGNPCVAHRLEHGELPAWMRVHAARLTECDTPPPESPRTPPTPPGRPPLPRRPRRPHSHRKPRRFGHTAWRLGGYTLAALAGALAHHSLTLL